MTILTPTAIPLHEVAKLAEKEYEAHEAHGERVTEYREDGEIVWCPQHYKKISPREWEMMGMSGEPQYKVSYFPTSEGWGCKEPIDFGVELPE